MANDPSQNPTNPPHGGESGSPPANVAASNSQGEPSNLEALQRKLVALEDEAFKNREKARIKKQQDEAAEAERQKQLKEQGEHKALAEQLQATVTELKLQIAERDREIAQRDYEALRATVAAKHGLAPALAARLRGQTESELETDAKELKKFVVEQTQQAGRPGNGPNPPPINPNNPELATQKMEERIRASRRYSSL